jgi:predicted enzyme related to lactoylglutathione lyase
MADGFVWFHNSSESPKDSITFYEKLLGWKPADGPPGMTMFAGDKGPFAAVGAKDGKVSGWIPYVQVDDVDGATTKAQKLGAQVLQPRTKGPAGEFTIVRDPGGASIALWQKA